MKLPSTTTVILMWILLLAIATALFFVIKYAIIAKIIAVFVILFGGCILFWGVGNIDDIFKNNENERSRLN